MTAATLTPGPRNLITDVPGLRAGNAHDEKARTGVSVILPDAPAAAGASIRGGAPGTRETEALDPACLVQGVHGIVLTGGSVFGLAAASDEVIKALAAQGTGFTYGAGQPPCPVVPGANLFDLTNGGNKDWGGDPPYRRLAKEALAAAGKDFSTGLAGAGFGATAGVFPGGLGSASTCWKGVTIGALAALNSFGAPFDPRTGVLLALDLALDGDFGDGGPCRAEAAGEADDPFAFSKARLIEEARLKAGMNTTLAVVATDARLDKAEAKRLAIMADDGLARAIRPIHTPYDGDVVFALSTGERELEGDRTAALTMLGALAADTLSRAVMRGVCAALGS